MKKFLLLPIVFLSVYIIIIFGLNRISAEENSPSSIQQLSEDIIKYENEIARLQGEAKTLSNQLAQYNAQINLTTLKIKQTQEKISLLGSRITQLETSLTSLTSAFSKRASVTYKISRLNDSVMLFAATDELDRAVSNYYYLKKIQSADRDLLVRLEKAQGLYKDEKVDEETLQKELNNEKTQLNRQKAAKAQLLEVTKNDEKKYQLLLVEAKAQMAALRNFVINQGGASILNNQTKCDGWGCYYNQRDSQWGNLALGGSPYSVAEYGCLVSSVSMLASHNGKNIKPIDIAVVDSAFVPGTGYLYHSFSVNGVSVSITTASKSVLDTKLAEGKPVIAGLYSGPDHFIVILRKDGDQYIMHDPFLENGGNRPLTDKYSVANISSLRLVSFN